MTGHFERKRAACAVLGAALGALAVMGLVWVLGAASSSLAEGAAFRDAAAAELPVWGQVLWREEGVSVCRAILQQDRPDIVGDGEGGAIMVWEDYRYGSNSTLFVQRVTSDGVAAWTTDGVRLSLIPGSQAWPQIIGDEEGGAIVVWEDYLGG